MRVLLVLVGLVGPCLIGCQSSDRAPSQESSEVFQAAIFDELAPLYPDSDISDGVQVFDLHTPRNVPAGCHLFVQGLQPHQKISWHIVDKDGSVLYEARVLQLIDVPVEQNTGIESRTEIWEDAGQNRYVVRDAPFRIYDALAPLAENETEANEQGILALRVELPIAADAAVGLKQYQILLTADETDSVELDFNCHVHAAVVPDVGAQSRGFTNWFSPDQIATSHELDLWSESYWKMLGQYADLMVRNRQDTIWVKWPHFFRLDDKGNPQLHQERLARYVQLFTSRGIKRIEGAPLARKHDPLDWSSGRLDLILTLEDVSEESGRAHLVMMATQIDAAIAALALEDFFLQHVSDEPVKATAESYRAVVAILREAMPGIEIFEATMTRDLVGAVDHWCPQVQEFQAHQDFFEARQAAGDGVWVYTCLAPGGEWLNRLLDQERLRPVYLAWALEKYDLDGFLHWGLNHYRDMDPFAQSVKAHPSAGPPNFLPPGDTHIVYPGQTGPNSSTRFEAHRIGYEDAELLAMLRREDPAAADGTITLVFRSFNDYATDVASYRQAKQQLLEALTPHRERAEN